MTKVAMVSKENGVHQYTLAALLTWLVLTLGDEGEGCMVRFCQHSTHRHASKRTASQGKCGDGVDLKLDFSTHFTKGAGQHS